MEKRMNKDYMSICVKGLFSRNVSKLDILELKETYNEYLILFKNERKIFDEKIYSH